MGIRAQSDWDKILKRDAELEGQAAYLFGAWLAVRMNENERHERKAATIDDVIEELSRQAIVLKRITDQLEELLEG